MKRVGLWVQYNLVITNWGEDLLVPISGEILFDTLRCTKIVRETENNYWRENSRRSDVY